MSTFTIDSDNNITAFATAEEAAQAGDSTATSFDSQGALAKAVAEWPLSRLVEIFNGIPGNTEVSKFQDRKKAVARIWKAIQPLAANGESSKAEPAAEQTESGRKKPAKAATKPAKKANAAKKAASATKGGGKGERSNKKAEVIAMMRRPKGVTLAEIMKVTQWQAHTVRGFVSILGSKGGLPIESSKSASGDRTYRIAK